MLAVVQTKRLTPDFGRNRPHHDCQIGDRRNRVGDHSSAVTLTARSPPHARPRHCVDGAAVVVIAFCATCQAERAESGFAKLRVVASGPTKRSWTTC